MATNICELENYVKIHQLNKLDETSKERKDIVPISIIQAIFDGISGARLDKILDTINFIYLPFKGTDAATRLLVPLQGRRKSLIVSYLKYDGTIKLEQYVANTFDDQSWSAEDNWKLPFKDASFTVNLYDEQLLRIITPLFDAFVQTPMFKDMAYNYFTEWLTTDTGVDILNNAINRELDKRKLVYYEPQQDSQSQSESNS